MNTGIVTRKRQNPLIKAASDTLSNKNIGNLTGHPSIKTKFHSPVTATTERFFCTCIFTTVDSIGDMVSLIPLKLEFGYTGVIAILLFALRSSEAFGSLPFPNMVLRGCVGSQLLAKVMETLCEGEVGREWRSVCAGTSSVMETSSSPLVPAPKQTHRTC